MKERSEELTERKGLADRELKRGRGGIRDIEFAVQLLQLVHGRHDESRPLAEHARRARTSSPPVAYVDRPDADRLDDAYRFLRTVEHRLQLYDEQQTHTIPADEQARTRLARVLGYRDSPERTALERVRSRPSRAPGRRARRSTSGSSSRRCSTRWPAPGRCRPRRPRSASPRSASPTSSGPAPRSASSRSGSPAGRGSCSELLPVILEWLSETPDPDLGLLQLRRLAEGPARSASAGGHLPRRSRRGRAHVPPARLEPRRRRRAPPPPRVRRCARRRRHARGRDHARRARRRRARHARVAGRRGATARGTAPLQATRAAAHRGARSARLRTARGDRARADRAGRGVPRSGARVARPTGARSPSSAWAGSAGPSCRTHPTSTCCSCTTATAPPTSTPPSTSRSSSCRRSARPPRRGRRSASTPASGRRATRVRWRGRSADTPPTTSSGASPGSARRCRRHGSSPATPPSARGSPRSSRTFVYGRPFTDDDMREIRRMKARIERERIPPGEDPQFHLKLGTGSLSDVEFTVQLLQLEHGGDHPELRAPGDDRRARPVARRRAPRGRRRRRARRGVPLLRTGPERPLPPERAARRMRCPATGPSSKPGVAARLRAPAALDAARRLPARDPPRPSGRRARVLRRRDLTDQRDRRRRRRPSE